MTHLRITMFQMNIIWNDKKSNLCYIREELQKLRGMTEIVILPEMFSTGFTMQSAELAETTSQNTITTLKGLAAEFDIALCGSFICKADANYYNRGFFLTPEGDEYYYDKRHLFRMGDEPMHFSQGNNPLIVSYKDWNINLLICYDLRFPAWSSNIDKKYDLLIYVASWPAARRKAWDALLLARAIENQAYVCGVNRVGTDGNGIAYNGGSIVYSPKGEPLAQCNDNAIEIKTVELDLTSLEKFRQKFPAWMDADRFEIEL